VDFKEKLQLGLLIQLPESELRAYSWDTIGQG